MNRALVGVITGIDPKLGQHKKIANILRKAFEVKESSAVYHYLGEEEEGLVVVYSIFSQQGPMEFKEKMDRMLGGIKGGFREIQILVFNDILLRTPEFSLPFEELHRLKRWVLPASEVWGDYIHPIINLDLKTLSERAVTIEKMEFFAQSQTLLDFLPIET